MLYLLYLNFLSLSLYEIPIPPPETIDIIKNAANATRIPRNHELIKLILIRKINRLEGFFKNALLVYLYVKDKIHYDLLLHIGIVIFTAVASAHAHSTYYEEGKFEGMNRFITIIILMLILEAEFIIGWENLIY